jgi:hypothetical protein
MISNMHEIKRKIRDLDYLTQWIQLYIFNLHDDRGPEDDLSSVDTYCLRNNLVKIHTIHRNSRKRHRMRYLKFSQLHY